MNYYYFITQITYKICYFYVNIILIEMGYSMTFWTFQHKSCVKNFGLA